MTILILATSLIFAMVVTPIVRQLALRINFVAVPKADRAHKDVTPLMGGVALYIGFIGTMLPLVLFMQLVSEDVAMDDTFTLIELSGVLLAATFIAGVGLWDDWHSLPSGLKLGFQFIPVLILITTTDVGIDMPVPGVLNLLITIAWLLYVINAINYMDNMDGVAGMTATIAGLFFMVIAIINEQFVLAALAGAVAGTSFGFLRYNLFKESQKIFMGDVGSLFLGFLLAVVGIKLTFPAESPWVTWPVPVLVLGVPIFDTGLVYISRVRRGKRFLDGGTDHLSHRFSRMGLGYFGVPFAVGLLGMVLGCLALVIMHSSLMDSLAVQVLTALSALWLLYKLEFSADHYFITGQRPEIKQPPPEVVE